ncbi:class I SAM-dependent methyltransferase [Dactylosporangium sp. NPDC051541]|uniref:class I SAM-dependent methyltransferase n=1 Tax=Dactylosporangium sp. NPDC051541 TaxID=3363977 RepID=UPI0037B3C224
MTEWTNEKAIQRWGTMPREALEAMAEDGDFAKRHLINPVLLRLLGEFLPGTATSTTAAEASTTAMTSANTTTLTAPTARRILDAGCGNGYLSRMLASRGAEVVGVEPGRSLFEFATEHESRAPLGIRYIQADLCALPDLGTHFDAVVCSMVLPAIPDWQGAMHACVQALKPGGLFVFTVNHPCFEELWSTWRMHGEYRTNRYLDEYEIPGPSGTDFHRPLSAYLNQLIALGCHLTEIAEPSLPVEAAATGPEAIDAYVHLPNFLIVAARRPA